MCHKLPVARAHFDRVEMAADQFYTIRIANCDERLSQFLRSQIQMVNGTPVVDDKFRFRDAITETMNVARAANKYFNDEEPWKSIKSDKEKADKTMFVCSQMINSLAILFAPVLPYTSANIQSLYSNEITIGDDALMVDIWSSAAMPMLKPGVQFRTPEILFGRIEDEFVDAEKDKLGETILRFVRFVSFLGFVYLCQCCL